MAPKKYRTKFETLKRLKALADGRDISYQDVVTETGLSYPTVHRYATKAVQKPDFEAVSTLAGYFGVTIDEFVYEAEEGHAEEQAPDDNQVAVA